MTTRRCFSKTGLLLYLLESILKEQVITAIGTIRRNRLGKDFTISKKDIKIDERGPIYLFYEGNDVCVVTWYDNDL